MNIPDSVLDAVHAVNQDVAADMPHDATQSDILEMCLDEFQFQMRGDGAAWKEYKALCKEYGHDAVFKALEPTISCW